MLFFRIIFLSGILFSLPSFAKSPLIKEVREIAIFKCIDINGTGTLHLKQGKKESLIVQAMNDDLPKITSEIKNGCLSLGPKKGNPLQLNDIHYYVTVNTLTRLQVAGNIEVYADNTLTSSPLELFLAGSGYAHLKIKNELFSGKISGNGEVVLQGSAQKQCITIEGNGQVDAKKLITEDSTVSTMGRGKMTVRALHDLNVTISGSGIVQYYGAPKIHQKISGSGEIIPLE
jgi:hypothetical protein